jgi:acyl-coenzyme A synthetase/AMP-(fatty) acid ligase
MNVATRVLHFGRTRPEEPALAEGERTIAYAELADRVRRTAGHLVLRGVRRGDRVGLCLKDSPEHLIALLAVTLVGAAAVPLDWRARPAENARFVADLGLSALLAEPDGWLNFDCAVLPLDAEWHRDVSRTVAAGDPDCDWNDTFAVSASSGSTGVPKFTLMSHLQYHFAAAGMLELMDLSGPHRFLCTLPLYYSGGRNSSLTHLLRGDCIVLYPSLFRPAEYLEVIRRERITTTALVPSMLRQLLAVSGSEPLLPEMAALFSTGAPLHADEKRQAVRKLTPNFRERYGTAETLAISILQPRDLADRASSVGQPHSLVEIEVADENGAPLAEGETGRLRIRGPGVASPLAGRAAESGFRDGWYYPGEIARLDEAGYIFLEGRTSDVIVRRGAKIFPAEVERALIQHPGVLEAAVLGHMGEDHDEIVVAFVVPRGTLGSGELLAHCRTHLTPHKVPRQIHFVDQLPKNTAGKIDKLALARSMAENGGPSGAS